MSKKSLQLNNNQISDLSLILLIGVLAALVFFSHLGDFALFNPDEGLYAEPAREMLDTGEWITTTLNYVVRFTKPPLVIWAMALCYKFFGVTEFAARFFCATSGFILTLITYLFTYKYLGRQIALLTAGILLTSPLFIGIGRMAITDMPLSLFVAGSLFAFFHAWQQKQPFWLWIGYVLTGLSIMCKGPVGIILPALILTIFFALRREIKAAVVFFRIIPGLLLIAIIALPWFLVEIATTHGAYFNEFILRENFARFTSVVDAHKGHWWYHLAAVFGGLFPWSIFLPQSIYTLTRNYLKDKASGGENSVLLFCFIWSVIVVAFFSSSVSKLLPYTLPAFPALAIIIANQWQILMNDNKRKNIFIYCLLIGVFYTGAVVIGPWALRYLRDCPPELSKLISQYSAVMSSILFLVISLILFKKQKIASYILLSLSVVSVICFVPKLLSVLSNFWEGKIPEYARFVSHSGKPLIVYALRKPAIPFYFGRPVIQAADKAELHKILNNSYEQYYLITRAKRIGDLDNYQIVSQDNNFILLVLSCPKNQN